MPVAGSVVIELSWSLRASRRLPLRDITWCSPLLSILRSVIVEVFAGGEPTPQPGIDANLNSIVLVPVTTKSPVWTPRAELPVPTLSSEESNRGDVPGGFQL